MYGGLAAQRPVESLEDALGLLAEGDELVELNLVLVGQRRIRQKPAADRDHVRNLSVDVGVLAAQARMAELGALVDGVAVDPGGRGRFLLPPDEDHPAPDNDNLK